MVSVDIMAERKKRNNGSSSGGEEGRRRGRSKRKIRNFVAHVRVT